MLSDKDKKSIQNAYRQFLSGRELKARYGQKLMIAAIARTLGGIERNGAGERDHGKTDGQHICVVEAGTGTGKTVSYLLAAIPMAIAHDKTLVISTATVALQEQIIYKDLPELIRHSGLKFEVSLAKGRGRYLCLSKLDQLLTELTSSGVGASMALYEDEKPQVDEAGIKLYRNMADQLATGSWDGDRDNWKDTIESEDWSRVTTDHRQCSGRRCPHVSSCSFFRARESLGKCRVIVANHDLLLADLALGGGAILPQPEDSIYVLDEAHHLPDKALNHFAHHSRVGATTTWLDQANKNLSQLLGEIGDGGELDRAGEELPALFTSAKQKLEMAWPLIEDICEFDEERGRPGNTHGSRNTRHRFEGGVVPESLMQLADQLREDFDEMESLLSKMLQAAQRMLEEAHSPVPVVDLERWYPVLGGWHGRAESNLELWANYSREDQGSVPQARWVTLVDWGGSFDFEVCSSPILAGKTLEYSLWRRCYGAVLTSATLTALGRFDRLQMRAGTPDNASYEMVPSPFDFSRAVLSVPKDAVEANKADLHTDAVIDALPKLLSAADGKDGNSDTDDAIGGALVLFASRRQMETVYESLPGTWRNRILMQGQQSRQELLERHKKSVDKGGQSVLFGLASFAEGLDLPGSYCRHVVIAKLPFAVPDDPIEAALAEWIEAKGGNAFMQITVPDAALKLVQACGRLLRTESDSGTITLLDRRIVTKRYGRAMLDSLPPFRRLIN